MQKILTVILVLLTISIGHSKEIRFNQKQIENMRFACDVGKKIYNKGTDSCFLMAALVYVESSAGMNVVGGKGHKSHGLFQNYVVTVQNRMKNEGINVSKVHIKDRLIKDRDFSAKYATIELKYWLKKRNGNLIQALASYNAGWKWQRGKGYANKVIATRNYLIKNNHKLKIRM